MNKKFDYVDQVARQLRQIAKDYEIPLREIFFRLGGIQIRWFRDSQDLISNGSLVISREGFIIEVLNVKAQRKEPQGIPFRWSDTIGSLPSEFKMYLRDQSIIEFVPRDEKTHLLLNAFWQVFHDGLNGQSQLFQNPIESGLGHRLREVANFLIDNQEIIGPVASVRIDDVPTRITIREFNGHIEPKFPEVNDKIHRWRLIQQLGAGGFGQVFKAEHVDSGELSAIKLMSPTRHDKTIISPSSQEFRISRERFLAEAALSLKVSTPFAVAAIDTGASPWPWIRYPLVSGKSVSSTFQNADDQRYEWWNLAHDLISALSTLHLEGILHKDIKPDNILRETDCYVLLDFGIGEITGYSELIAPGRIGGTFGFMAPELIVQQDPNYQPGFEIDIFSAGMTLLSILDRQPLVQLQSTQITAFRNSNVDVLKNFMRTPISLEGAPDETKELLSSMLDFNPSRRPSAKSLLKYVARHVDLEEKLKLIQSHRQRGIMLMNDDVRTGTDQQFQDKFLGPLASWKPIEDRIYDLIFNVRPHYFTITLNPDNEKKMVYVQAMSGAGGWQVEAMSEAFAVKKQSDEIKRNFLTMNWTAPSASEPNFSMSLSDPPAPDVVRVLVNALEFGFGILPSQVELVQIDSQGTGKY